MHYVDPFLDQILKGTKKICILYLPNNTFTCYNKIKYRNKKSQTISKVKN